MKRSTRSRRATPHSRQKKTGSCVGFEMFSSFWRRCKKSSAVVRSPSVPAMCGLVANWREVAIALSLFGTDLKI